MTLKQLDYFFALCRTPHISGVVKELGVSQPAISLAIKNLEEELEEPLFSRIGKKLILNERGRDFKDRTEAHFLALRDAGEMFKSDRISGNLTIADSKTFNTYLMPQIIFDFRTRYPEVDLKKRSTNSTHIFRGINSGAYDIGFVETNLEDQNLIKEKIGEDELIVVSGDRELASETHFIDTLFDRQWILREVGSGTRDVFLEKLAEIGLEPDIFLELPEFEEIKNILLDNPRTITCISRLAVRKELERGELYHVRLNNLVFNRGLFVVYHKNRFQTNLFRRFIDFTRDEFGM